MRSLQAAVAEFCAGSRLEQLIIDDTVTLYIGFVHVAEKFDPVCVRVQFYAGSRVNGTCLGQVAQGNCDKPFMKRSATDEISSGAHPSSPSKFCNGDLKASEPDAGCCSGSASNAQQ